jgi:hypothetical protein
MLPGPGPIRGASPRAEIGVADAWRWPALGAWLEQGANVSLPDDPHYDSVGTGARITVLNVSAAPGSWPPALDPVATELVSWLQHFYRKPPDPDSLQPYLDEFAFRNNVGGRDGGRERVRLLLDLATVGWHRAKAEKAAIQAELDAHHRAQEAWYSEPPAGTGPNPKPP